MILRRLCGYWTCIDTNICTDRLFTTNFPEQSDTHTVQIRFVCPGPKHSVRKPSSTWKFHLNIWEVNPAPLSKNCSVCSGQVAHLQAACTLRWRLTHNRLCQIRLSWLRGRLAVLARPRGADAWALCVCASSYRAVSPVVNTRFHFATRLCYTVWSTSCAKTGGLLVLPVTSHGRTTCRSGRVENIRVVFMHHNPFHVFKTCLINFCF